MSSDRRVRTPNPPAAECVPWANARGSAQRSAPPLQQSPRWRRYWTGAAWRKEGAARKKYTAAGNNRICSSHERSAFLLTMQRIIGGIEVEGDLAGHRPMRIEKQI